MITPRDNSILDKTMDSGEPIIVFRAQDKHSISVLTSYMMTCISDPDCDWNFIHAIMDRIEQFRGWQHQNKSKVKTPDL